MISLSGRPLSRLGAAFLCPRRAVRAKDAVPRRRHHADTQNEVGRDQGAVQPRVSHGRSHAQTGERDAATELRCQGAEADRGGARRHERCGGGAGRWRIGELHITQYRFNVGRGEAVGVRRPRCVGAPDNGDVGVQPRARASFGPALNLASRAYQRELEIRLSTLCSGWAPGFATARSSTISRTPDLLEP